MEKTLNKLVDNLKEKLGERLSSVFLYGSCAADACVKSSDVNLMVIVKDLKAQDLKLANKFTAKFAKKAKALPVFMDKDEWFNSCDVYAIEYTDIKQRHKILFGEDLISGLNVDKNHLRLQCEKEVKSLLVRLRQSYLANASDKKLLKNLIKGSSKTFMVIFRTVLILNGERVPVEHSEVVSAFGEKIKNDGVDFDQELFLKILQYRTSSKSIKNSDLDAVVQKLIDTTNSVLKYVDKQ